MIDSVEEIVRLRTSDDPEEYSRATWDEASVSVWLEVIQKHADMRFWVAQNKSVPNYILEVLASDDDPHVRWMVASKNGLPESLQLKLAQDIDATVRSRIAHNKRATLNVLELLSSDADDEIKALAQRRIVNKEYM